MVKVGTLLVIMFTVCSIILGVGLAILFLYLNLPLVIVVTLIALVGVIVPLVIKGRCLLGSCTEEEEKEEGE